jgi:pimeloyl-ACP methyl ester carboxylesterase
MRSEEIVAAGELAGDALGGAATRIHDMHAGIADRVFGSIGPAAEPVRVVHDSIARGVYRAVRTASSALVRAGAAQLSVATPPDSPSIAETARGRLVTGALNGAHGDLLARRGSALAVRMTVRRGGRDLELSADALASALPNAQPRVAVFLHGLCESDDAWRLRSDRHRPYGDRLEAELGYTSLYINYNSGLHISENGRECAELLSSLVQAWPVPVHELALVGHSMGGLVARSACHYGASSDWASKVRHVFTLGAPHHGAPLEQVAHRASVAFARLPETRALARALNLRSAGIKDLRHGYLIDEDWLDQDPDAYLRNTGREIPFLESANHYFVCATLSREPHAPVGRMIGDLLVMRASAWGHRGKGQRMRFPVEHYSHVGGANHFDLLNHPAIYEQIRRWLARRPALLTAPV